MSKYGSRIVLVPALAVFMLLSPGLASADGDGFFIGGGVYWGMVDEGSGELSLDDSSAAWNIDLGYRFNKWIAIDGGYWGLGKYESNGAEADLGAWTLGGIASVPVWLIDIYARGGAAFWSADYKVLDVKDDDSSTDWYGGLGLAFNLGDHIDLYGEWDRFFLDADVDVFGLGMRFTF